MRVIECNQCGETVSAATDGELAARLRDHLATEHSEQPPEAEVAALVSEQAYDAMDS